MGKKNFGEIESKALWVNNNATEKCEVTYAFTDRSDGNFKIGKSNVLGENVALTIDCNGVIHGTFSGTFNGGGTGECCVGGSDGDVQFNDDGEPGGDSSFTWDGTKLKVPDIRVVNIIEDGIPVATSDGTLEGDADLTFDGTELTVATPVSATLLIVPEITLAGDTRTTWPAAGAPSVGADGDIQTSDGLGGFDGDSTLTYDGTNFTVGTLTDAHLVVTPGANTVAIKGVEDGTDDCDLTFSTTDGGTTTQHVLIDSVGRVGIGAAADLTHLTGGVDGGSLTIGAPDDGTALLRLGASDVFVGYTNSRLEFCGDLDSGGTPADEAKMQRGMGINFTALGSGDYGEASLDFFTRNNVTADSKAVRIGINTPASTLIMNNTDGTVFDSLNVTVETTLSCSSLTTPSITLDTVTRTTWPADESSVGVTGTVQTSDGTGGFSGDTGLTYDGSTLSSSLFTTPSITLDTVTRTTWPADESSVGVTGTVQTSDGTGGFSGDTGLTYDGTDFEAGTGLNPALHVETDNTVTLVGYSNIFAGETFGVRSKNQADDDSILVVSKDDSEEEILEFGVGTGKAIIGAGNQDGGNTSLTFETSEAGTKAQRVIIDEVGRVGIGVAAELIHLTGGVEGGSLTIAAPDDGTAILRMGAGRSGTNFQVGARLEFCEDLDSNDPDMQRGMGIIHDVFPGGNFGASSIDIITRPNQNFDFKAVRIGVTTPADTLTMNNTDGVRFDGNDVRILNGNVGIGTAADTVVLPTGSATGEDADVTFTVACPSGGSAMVRIGNNVVGGSTDDTQARLELSEDLDDDIVMERGFALQMDGGASGDFGDGVLRVASRNNTRTDTNVMSVGRNSVANSLNIHGDSGMFVGVGTSTQAGTETFGVDGDVLVDGDVTADNVFDPQYIVVNQTETATYQNLQTPQVMFKTPVTQSGAKNAGTFVTQESEGITHNAATGEFTVGDAGIYSVQLQCRIQNYEVLSTDNPALFQTTTYSGSIDDGGGAVALPSGSLKCSSIGPNNINVIDYSAIIDGGAGMKFWFFWNFVSSVGSMYDTEYFSVAGGYCNIQKIDNT